MFHITLILEAVTDGRCLGWLELVPDFVANFKEGVIETWCSNRNCCCAIHTEPGIHHTSSWLEDFSCLHLYFCSIQQLMASVIMIPFFGFGADICCRFHGRCEIGTLRAHQRHQRHILTWIGWRGHEQHHRGIEEGKKFDGYYRGLWRWVQSLVHAAAWLIYLCPIFNSSEFLSSLSLAAQRAAEASLYLNVYYWAPACNLLGGNPSY